MKRVLSLLVLVPLVAGCKKTPATPAATTTAQQPAGAPSAMNQGMPPGMAQGMPPGMPGMPPQAPPAKPMPAALPDVLAKVNGESVERWELENALKRAEARAGSPVPADKRDEVLRRILDQIIAFHALAIESHARKLDPTDAEVDAQLAMVKKQFPDEAEFQKNLTSEGLTLATFRRQTMQSMRVQKIVELEVNSKVAVADNEVDAFYQMNLERFKEGDSVHASHILIEVPKDADEAAKKAARAKAEGILKQARAPKADFAKLAKENSQDPGSAPNGGDLGFFPKGQMTPTFEEAAFKLKPGTVSGLVESPFGFHIIKVTERRGPRTTPLAEVGPQIKEFLLHGQRQTKLDQFIEQAKAKTKIQILV